MAQLNASVPDHTPATTDRRMCRKDAAQYLGLSEQTLRKWATRRTGPAYSKLGGAVRYSLSDLRAFLDANRVDNDAA